MDYFSFSSVFMILNNSCTTVMLCSFHIYIYNICIYCIFVIIHVNATCESFGALDYIMKKKFYVEL